MKSRISNIEIEICPSEMNMVGFASLVFDGCLHLRHMGIYKTFGGSDSIVYPSVRSSVQWDKKGFALKSNVLFGPIGELSKEIESAVVAEYKKVVGIGKHGIDTLYYTPSDDKKPGFLG